MGFTKCLSIKDGTVPILFGPLPPLNYKE